MPIVDIDKLAAVSKGFISRPSFVSFFSDVLNISTYSKLKPKKELKIKEVTYRSNESFWKEVIGNKHYEGEYLSLKEFHLTEWIPLSPGSYFLPESKGNRILAEKYVNYERSEFLPHGKDLMVIGGMGSLRLNSKFINSKKYFLLGASSNGVTHEGVPVAITEYDYIRLINKIKDTGGCICNIHGSLEVIPKDSLVIQYRRNIPRFYILADAIEFIDFSQKNVLTSTIAIMFPSPAHDYDFSSEGYAEPVYYSAAEYRTNLVKRWSFCNFNPSSIESLNIATQWLEEYASRYSGMINPPILNDFDEYYDHFPNPIEFPTKSLGSGFIDPKKIEPYRKYYIFDVNIKKGDFVMGEKIVGGSGITAGGNVNFDNVSGQVAIGENIIQIQSIGQTELEELRKSLIDLQKGFEKIDLSSDDRNIVNGDISAAIKEAKKEKPVLSRIKEKFESVINTVKEAGKTIKDISELYEPAKKIAPLLGIAISFLH